MYFLLIKFVLDIFSLLTGTPDLVFAQNACTTTLNPGMNISSAYAAANPGDIICLNSGTYQQPLNLAKSGLPGNPITIRSADTKLRATIDCKTCGIAAWGAIIKVSGSHIVLENINIQNSSDFNAPGGVESIQGISAADGTDLKLLNIKMSNIVDSCILTQRYNNITIDGGEYFNCNMDNQPQVRALHKGDWSDNWGSGFSIAHASDNVTIRNITLRDSWGEGINFWSGAKNGLAENNTLYNIWGPYLYIDRGSFITLRNNIVYVRRMSDGVIGRPIEIMNEDGAVTARYPKMNGNKVYNNILINDGSSGAAPMCVNVDDFDGSILEGDLLIAHNTCIRLTSFEIGNAAAGKIHLINNLKN